MSRMGKIKILIGILCIMFAMCFALAGCAASPQRETVTNIQNYTLVYNPQDAYGAYYATLLQEFFAAKGVDLPVVTDAEEEVDYEILLGNTNRYQTAFTEQEYAVRLRGDKLLFEGGHAVMVEKAVKTFIANGKTAGDVCFAGADASFTSTAQVDEIFGILSESGVTYTYVWGDEFDGNVLDRTKFYTKAHGYAQNDRAFTTINGETVRTYNEYDFLDNSPYGYVKNGNATFHGYTDENGITHNARAFCTDDTMCWRYGYAELRAKVPLYANAWPAWWTTANHDMQYYPQATEDNGVVPTADWRYMPEIDMFEFWGDNGNPCANLHKWFRQGCFTDGAAGTNPEEYTIPTQAHAEAAKEAFIKARLRSPSVSYDPEKHTVIQTERMQSGKQQYPPVSVDEGYHTFGFLWTPEKMIMSVDGQVYGRYDLTDEMCLDALKKGNKDDGDEYIGMSMFRDMPAHMIFDNWVNTLGDSAGTKELAKPGSRDFVIDYIRLYQVDTYRVGDKEYKSGLWNYGLERVNNK